MATHDGYRAERAELEKRIKEIKELMTYHYLVWNKFPYCDQECNRVKTLKEARQEVKRLITAGGQAWIASIK